jgi:pimeloyl-ACP methyl ester carboxylesterase
MMQTARCGDLTLSYEDLGAGEPALLCLPGWCASRGAFSELAARLAPRHRILTLDWRGHGGSGSTDGDFGLSELVDDALAVIEASGARQVIPVATAHAGWVAIELRRRLGERIPKLVLVDWIVTDPPAPFLGALAAMEDPTKALQVRDQLFAMWTEGVEHAGVLHFVREHMGSHGAAMWARAAREIAAAYAREGSPLRALAALGSPPPVLHLYAQPADPGYLAAQQSFAAEHPWFAVRRVEARSHFPTIEVPEQMQEPIERFVAPTKAVFEKAFPYGNDVLALPVTDLESVTSWYARHFAMVEVERKSEPQPTVILERDAVRMGFAVNGGDSSQDGAAILVNDIHAARAELEGRGVEVRNWRIDERDGKRLQVFFVVAPDGLCYYFHQPLEWQLAE